MARAMKDSGIEWIGEIPEGWSVVSLGRLFSASAGGDAKQELYSDYQDETHPYPVYTNTLSKDQVYAYTTTPFFQSNTITVTGRGAIGHAFYRDTPYDAIIRLLSLCPKQTLNCRFYAYWIDTVIPFFTDSAAIGQLSAIQITKYKTLFLPLREQDKISEYLDIECSKINTIIEQTRASIEEYKKLKQSVITQAVTKGIRPGRKMKDSGVEWIGEIPEEWTCQNFKYIAAVKSNLVQPEDYLDYPQVSPENIEKGSGQLLSCRSVRDVGVISGNHLFYKGQILYSKIRPKLNKVTIAPFDGLCSADMYPIETKLNTEFFVYEMRSETFLSQISLITEDRVKMPKINQEELGEIPFAVPPTEEQEEIVCFLGEKLETMDRLIHKKELFIEELEAYKKSLIFEYVTGKKEVI